eukprot:gene16872-35021_t
MTELNPFGERRDFLKAIAAVAGTLPLCSQAQSAWPSKPVTLSHPGKFNAMSRAMWRELKAVFVALQSRSDVRCVIVAGEGGHFCAGGDIAEYADFRHDEPALQRA